MNSNGEIKMSQRIFNKIMDLTNDIMQIENDKLICKWLKELRQEIKTLYKFYNGNNAELI